MSNNEDDYSVLKYRVKQLEDLVKPLIELVNNLDKKISLLTQKMLIATALLGTAFQGFGIWYSTSKSEDLYTENEKKLYYDMRVQESETVKALREEIERLKKERR